MEGNLSLKNIQVSSAIEDLFRLGVVVFRALTLGEQNPRLTQAIKSLAEELGKSMGDRKPSSLPAVLRTRRLYHHLGLDPTKHRPSSEKLLRRVLRGHPFPRTNDFVDAMNLVSVRLQFPLGLYDWDRLVLPVLVRIGSPNEAYQGISGDLVQLDGRIVLVDGEGPFGSPTQDSERTLIHRGTVRALVIIFAPADTPRTEIEEAITEVVEAGRTFCDGQAVVTGILP
jgi:DNA/RNA-binding domain of Phe-tRNA-synthetase-like protein